MSIDPNWRQVLPRGGRSGPARFRKSGGYASDEDAEVIWDYLTTNYGE